MIIKNDYSEMYEKSLKKAEAMAKGASHPIVIAKLIYKAARSRGYQLRLPCRKNAGLGIIFEKNPAARLFFILIRLLKCRFLRARPHITTPRGQTARVRTEDIPNFSMNGSR